MSRMIMGPLVRCQTPNLPQKTATIFQRQETILRPRTCLDTLGKTLPLCGIIFRKEKKNNNLLTNMLCPWPIWNGQNCDQWQVLRWMHVSKRQRLSSRESGCTPVNLCIQCIRHVCHLSCIALASFMTNGRWTIWGVSIHVIWGWPHNQVKITRQRRM